MKYLLLLFWVCSLAAEDTIALSTEQIEEFEIETKKAGPGSLSISISTRGKVVLHPDKLAHILPKVSGVAKEVRKNIGDKVRKNEILALIESREMAEVKANYLASVEKEKLALSLYDREKRLYEKQISSEQEYLNAKSAYEEAKINAQLGKQKLYAFGLDDREISPDFRLYEIRSPMNGTVIMRHITKGEFVGTDSTIFEVADLSSVWVEIGIYPNDLQKVKVGQLVEIENSSAKIVYLSPIIEDETITAKAIAEMANPDEIWRPGTFVKVNISTENASLPIVIPRTAIQEIEGKEYIFVRSTEGFEKRAIESGKNDRENIEIISGLVRGEEYASSKTFLFKADLKKEEATDD